MEERIFEYLAQQYNRLGTLQQQEMLDEIIQRLVSKEILTALLAQDIVKGLEETEHYTMDRILAHLDMLDLEDRI